MTNNVSSLTPLPPSSAQSWETPPSPPPKPLLPPLFRNTAFAAIGLSCCVAGYGYVWLLYPRPLDQLLNQNATRLTRAKRHYHRGDMEAALRLVRAIPPDSDAYPEAQAVIAQWQPEWQQSEKMLVDLTAAADEQNWDRVLAIAATLPETPFWQRHGTPIIQSAQAEIDQRGRSLLQQAFDHAFRREFTAALDCLSRISPYASVYERVPQKIEEYTRNRDLRAQYFLHEAFRAAQEKNFDRALEHLNQIDRGASVYFLAQEKITEYVEKQQIRTDYLLTQATLRAKIDDFPAAIRLLQQISSSNPQYSLAQDAIAAYRTAWQSQEKS